MRALGVSGVTVTPFTVPFIRPVTVAGQMVAERSGFYLDVTAAGGLTVRAEAAPLPGISRESLKKAGHDAGRAEGLLQGGEFPTDRQLLMQALREHPGMTGLCASVRCAVEAALFTLAGRLNGLELSAFFGGRPQAIERAVLLQGAYEPVIAEAAQRRASGARVYKLKVGDRNVALDVKKVAGVREVMGPEGRLRLDANGAWDLKDAVLFAQLAGTARIEFIEEPLRDMSQAGEFYRVTGMPVALDESLQVMRCGVTAPGRCQPTMAASDAVAAYVLKPMILGGIVVTLDWMEEAARMGKQAVISSAFETPVGMAVLEALATLTPAPAGLDTLKWSQNVSI